LNKFNLFIYLYQLIIRTCRHEKGGRQLVVNPVMDRYPRGFGDSTQAGVELIAAKVLQCFFWQTIIKSLAVKSKYFFDPRYVLYGYAREVGMESNVLKNIISASDLLQLLQCQAPSEIFLYVDLASTENDVHFVSNKEITFVGDIVF